MAFSSAAFAIITVALTVSIGSAQVTSCRYLSKVSVPSNWLFVVDSPYITDFSVQSINCSSVLFTKAALWDPDYDGSLTHVQGSSVTIYDYKVGSDSKTVTMKICRTGASQTWYFADANFNNYGSYFCMYTCEDDLLLEYKCSTNNRTEFLDDEQASVNRASSVATKSGQTIHSLPIDCFGQRCKAFY